MCVVFPRQSIYATKQHDHKYIYLYDIYDIYTYTYKKNTGRIYIQMLTVDSFGWWNCEV